MAETNGHAKTRLDRIEEMIERQVLANEAAHERFEAEDKRLLTAQILMNEAMTKTNKVMTKMIGTMEKLETRMLQSTEKLDALIRVVDGVIRRGPSPEGSV